MNKRKITLGALAAFTIAAVTLTTLPAQASVSARSGNDKGPRISAATVSQHATAADCWVIVGKGVYDITGFISKHPGGAGSVTALCGTNGTKLFAGQHAGNGETMTALKPYRVGTLDRRHGQGSDDNRKPKPPVTHTGSYSMADVAKHASATDCWTVVNGKVYNLSSFVRRHEGGAAAITSLCGIDGTAMYLGQHGPNAKGGDDDGDEDGNRPSRGSETDRVLARFMIGTLSGSSATPTPTPTPTPTTTPTPTPTPTPPVTFTAADVAKHSTATNCWTIVSGKVYDVTPWVNKHPGGSAAIIGMCGKDGTTSFNGIHSSSNSAKNTLAGFLKGTLV